MARVYEVADLQAESRIVAVKILQGRSDYPVVSTAFEREPKSLLRLSHRNIVDLLDAERDPETDERYPIVEWMENDLESAIGDPPK